MTETDAPSVLRKWSRRWFQLSAFLFLACVILAVALLAVVKANRAEQGVQGTCQVWHDLAWLPLSPTTTKTGLQLVADGRVQFTHLSCSTVKYGPLPALDKRVADVLKAQGH